MSTPVLMPRLGESVVEGTVSRWLKRVGESVTKLEPLLEISTDKIDTEIPAPASGVLLAIAVAEGETVAVGAQLGVIGAAGEGTQNAVDSISAASAQSEVAESIGQGTIGRDYLSPVVRRMAAEHAVDLNRVEGTGQGGRITRKDLEAWLAANSVSDGARRAQDPAAVEADFVLRPLSRMRRAIARAMVESVAASPQVTTVHEVDLSAVFRHREAQRGEFERRGVRLSVTPYFVVAVARALLDHPAANGRFTEDGIVEYRRVHLGVAVATDEGLIVPIVRDAHRLDLEGAARAVQDVAERARAGTLLPDEVQGATFTITNHGVGGSLIATPILPHPQAGILGVGAIVKRPVVVTVGEDDAIVVRPMCYLSFTFDHRVLDGATADAFVRSVIKYLQVL